MKKIPIGHGKFALVDDEDFERISAIRWNGSEAYAKHVEVSYMHRVILGAKKGEVIDHINGDPLDNRRSNLRLCTHAQNCANGRHAKGVTGFIGVVRKRGKFAAQLSINDHTTYIGTYDTPQEAADARDKEAARLRGEFARLNNA